MLANDCPTSCQFKFDRVYYIKRPARETHFGCKKRPYLGLLRRTVLELSCTDTDYWYLLTAGTTDH
jgi:hypothetical protein